MMLPVSLVFFAAPCRADARDYEGRRIAAIRFDPARQPLDPSEAFQILPLRINEPLRLTDVSSAIKRLYATGFYADVRAAVEPADSGVIVIFLTTIRWFVGRVDVEGNLRQPPSAGQLVNAAGLNLGQPFHDADLSAAVDGMQRVLRSNGFYEARVDPRLAYDARTQQVRFRFVITEGPRARLRAPQVTGRPEMPVEKVIRATKWKGLFGWKPATFSNVQRGLQRLRDAYRAQNRLTASVAIAAMEYDKSSKTVTPTLRAEGGPKVVIRTTGAPVSRSRLHRYVPVFDEGVVYQDLLIEGARNLENYFQSKGYFDATVTFSEQRAGPNELDIQYAIQRGGLHKLVRVDIRGNRYFDTAAIRERMFLQPAGRLRLRRGRFSRGFLRRDEESIQALYKSNGFREVKVTADVLDDYEGRRGDLAVVLTIEEGPQYLVSSLTLTGAEQIDARELLGRLASGEGQPFSEASVAADRDQIIRYYQDQGFPDATFDWTFKPGSRPHTVDLRYSISEGRRQFVRGVLVGGLDITRPSVVQTNVLLAPGAPLSLNRMTETQRRLYNLNIFSEVNMAVQNPSGEARDKYLLYELREARRYNIAAGFGAYISRIGGSQTSLASPAGATGFSPRVSFDVTRLNFLGRAQTLTFGTAYSTLRKTAVVNYLIPKYRNVEGRNLSFAALYDNSNNVRTFSSLREEGSAQLSQKLSKTLTALASLTYRRVTISNLKIDPLLVPLLSQPEREGVISGSLIQDRRDDPTDAHNGIYNTIDAGIAPRIAGSSSQFARFLARNATYHALTKQITLARSLQFGVIQPYHVRAGDPSEGVPLAERFFGGGDTSNRGFPENQAGPRDLLTGFPLGGNALLFHSTELRFPLIGNNIGGVLFHDAGNVYARPGDISFRVHQRNIDDFNYMVHAVGFGLRYRTPIGPVRLDLAYSINPPSFFGFQGTTEQLLSGTGLLTVQQISHFQFFFSIGQTF
jgi:outer membrane protein insertion porin family